MRCRCRSSPRAASVRSQHLAEGVTVGRRRRRAGRVDLSLRRIHRPCGQAVHGRAGRRRCDCHGTITALARRDRLRCRRTGARHRAGRRKRAGADGRLGQSRGAGRDRSDRRAVYWSRSRGRLWRKGEESGHTQQVVEIRLDCDGDVVLYAVRQAGGIACHTGRESCFYRRLTADTGKRSIRC